jgi:hypothetical protein
VKGAASEVDSTVLLGDDVEERPDVMLADFVDEVLVPGNCC